MLWYVNDLSDYYPNARPSPISDWLAFALGAGLWGWRQGSRTGSYRLIFKIPLPLRSWGPPPSGTNRTKRLARFNPR
jgi:hypothetical protein